MNMKQFALLLVFGVSLQAQAAGPEAIARSNRSLWPENIDSVSAYNRASRAEILVFASALGDIIELNDDELKTTLKIKSLDRNAINTLKARLQSQLLNNIKIAQSSCAPKELFCSPINSAQGLQEAGKRLSKELAEPYRPWFENANNFHRTYAQEMVRLAALFSRVSSEIATFDSSERNGTELRDGHFLWTFDDGPSKPGGTSDALIATLAQHHIHAIFYTLGERMKSRLQSESAPALQKMYADQCLASHGWVHESHQKMEQWQSSITDTAALLKENFPTLYRPFFRPPYGQRRDDSGPFFLKQGITVGLWNIDSQDWNVKLSEHDAAQRVFTLMLLWRKGVILFHDVHNKAVTALPWIMEASKAGEVHWDDCRTY